MDDLSAWKVRRKNSFSVPVQRVYTTSVPVYFYPDTTLMELKCIFKGWPRPRVAWYKRNYYNYYKRMIINGSESFYLYEQLIGEDTISSVLLIPNFHGKRAMAYECTGMNSITGWSSRKSERIYLANRCK